MYGVIIPPNGVMYDIDMITQKADSDDLAEISEVLMDKASKGFLDAFLGTNAADFIESVPAGKLTLAIAKLFVSAKDHHRTKMLRAFLSGLQSGSRSFDDFKELDENMKNDLRGLVLTQLDLQADERQAEAMGLIVDAYLAKKIDRLIFIGIIFEIKNTNPLLYYFSVDSLTIDKMHTNFGKPVIKGNVRLLPAVFYISSATESSHGWSAVPGSVDHPTGMGEAFFKYVYEPMSEKYQI